MTVEPWRYADWKRALGQIGHELEDALLARKHERVTAESAELLVFNQRLKQLWFDLDRLEKRARREAGHADSPTESR